ncbi:MAG: M23 family metallopeptidase [Anaeromyxobacter sp.]
MPASAAAAGLTVTGELQVVPSGFRVTTQNLTLPKQFVEPPAKVKKRMEADLAAFKAAYDQPFCPPLFEGDFDWPRQAPTSGRFGDTRVLNGKKASVHYGLDLTGPRGSPIAAANDGVVAIARDAYLSGNTVILFHGGGMYTTYLHMDRMAVKTGDRVKRGQLLGELGSTGRSTGPHLHWGAKVGGLYVDPESLLQLRWAPGTAPDRTPAAPEGPAPAAAEAPSAAPESAPRQP